MKKYFFVGCLSILLLIGAGCGTKKETVTTTATTTPTSVAIDTTLQQQAYLFCTQKGYTVKIRFVDALNSNVAYCVLPRDQECDTVSYMNGSCPTNASTTEDNTNMFEPVLADQYPLRLCEAKADPVCGADGKTYTNRCVAQFLQVKITHTGTCTKSADTLNEQKELDTKVTDISEPAEEESFLSRITLQAPAVGTTSQTDDYKTDNEWVEIPTALLHSTSSDTIVRRCGQGTGTTFLTEESAGDHFTTLYNQKGEVLCYPDNDIQNECPSFVARGNYKASCQVVPHQ